MSNEYNENNENIENKQYQEETGNKNLQETIQETGSREQDTLYRFNASQINQDTLNDYQNHEQSSDQGGYERNTSSYTTYVYPEQKKKIKFRNILKIRGVKKTVQFIGAAVAFGLIAGIVFRGVNELTQSELKSSEIVQNDNGQETKTAAVQMNDQASDGNILTASTSSKAEVVTDISDVVKNVKPSIVAINASATVTSYDFFGQQYNEPVKGSGSGIIIEQLDSQIIIVTNNHVIEGAKTVEIVFEDGSKANATVKGSDANADLAILSVNMDDLSKDTIKKIRVATIGDSNDVGEGDMAIAIGNALGYGQSTTVGYISAVNRKVTIDDSNMTLIQTDAAINPGNSGGALLNIKGEVIGINSVKYASKEVEGMGYAIPISDAVPLLNVLINRKEVAAADRGYLGLSMDPNDPANCATNVTDVYAERYNMPIGIYVNKVIPKSPAEKAGLMQGHIIVGVNKLTVETIDDLKKALSYTKAGETIELKIKELDNGKYIDKTLSVTLGKR